MSDKDTIKAFTDGLYKISIEPRYYLTLKVLFNALGMAIFPIAVTTFFLKMSITTFDFQTFTALKIIFVIITAILLVPIAFLIGLIMVLIVDCFFVSTDRLSFTEEALVFGNRKKILFKDIKKYCTYHHIQGGGTLKAHPKLTHTYYLHLKTSRPSYSCLIEYASSLENSTPYDDKSFADNACAMIDTWRHNHQ